MNKISQVQAGQMMKLAAENLRSLSAEKESLVTERDELLQKVAGFEHERRVEKVAKAMESKGLNPDLSFDEKIASLRQHEKLEVLEEAVNLSAPQMKLASVDGETEVVAVGGEADAALDAFAANLANAE